MLPFATYTWRNQRRTRSISLSLGNVKDLEPGHFQFIVFNVTPRETERVAGVSPSIVEFLTPQGREKVANSLAPHLGGEEVITVLSLLDAILEFWQTWKDR